MKRLPSIMMCVVFVIGLGIFLYPVVSDYINTRSQTRAVADYAAEVEALEEADYRDILEQARLYNTNLTYGNRPIVRQLSAGLDYESTLRVGNNDVMGYIEIEKIDLRLPLYHTTKHAVLQTGVGHIEGTSLPIGGKNTHAVLSGHRGLPSSKLFTDLDQMQEGDSFTIRILNRRLTYRVDHIEVVEPDEVDTLDIVPGEDYVTLVTCTPYGVNTHRLLIRGARTENPAEPQIVTDTATKQSGPFFILLIAGSVVLLAAGLLLGVTRRRWE